MARTPKKAQPTKDGAKGRKRDELATIYGLSCPDTGMLRYIGQTWYARSRQWQYGNLPNNRGNRPVCAWVRKLLKQGKRPKFFVIETTDKPDEREALAIKVAREHGFAILNLADGGQQNGHLVRAKEEALGTRGRNWATITLSELTKLCGQDHPRTVRVREAIKRGEQRFGKREYHRRVNQRHAERIAASEARWRQHHV